jgi:hypothetical protein
MYLHFMFVGVCEEDSSVLPASVKHYQIQLTRILSWVVPNNETNFGKTFALITACKSFN